MQSLSPVQSNEREIFMDVLRGFAILGIFIANLNAFSWYDLVDPAATGPFLSPKYDGNMLFLHHMFIEGKFYSIFSFLFGWGISLQLMRSEAKGTTGISIIRRRLCFMLLLGAIHLTIWPGDIVFFYALLGFLLLPLRRFTNKTLLITGIVLVLSPVLLYWLKMKFPVFHKPSDLLFGIGMWADERLNGITSEEAFKNLVHTKSWFAIWKADLSGFFFRYGDLVFISRIPKVLGMMLIGLVVGRTNFYKNIMQHKKLLWYIVFIGLVISIPANYMLAKYMSLNDGAYNQLKPNGFYRTIAYATGVAPLAAVYISLFMLSFQATAGKKILSIFAPVGKMAFSNYIMHTLIGNFVFYNAGLGYMEKVGPVYYTLFAVIVFIAQIMISTLWLKYFNYGPIEWLWRSATYKKWQPLKKISIQ